MAKQINWDKQNRRIAAQRAALREFVPTTFPSRFSQTCKRCRQHIDIGDPVYKVGGGVIHGECPR